MKMNRFSNRALAIVTALLLLFQQIPALAAAEEWNSAASDPIGTEDYVTVRFTADGEEVAALLVRAGAAIGRLPDAPEREGYAFLGWFAGEEPVTEETVVTAATEITASYINEAYPALRADYDNGRIAVRVSAPEGALPKGVSPVMETVSDELVRETVEGVMGHAVGQIAAVNISFLDENGSKIQPEKPVKVQIALTGMQADRVSVVHIPDELLPSPAKSGKKLMSARRGAAPAAEVVDFSVQGDTLSFDADSFSVYAVVEDVEPESRMTVHFYGKDTTTPLATMYIKNSDDLAAATQILFDPGAGTLADGETFRGWVIGDIAHAGETATMPKYDVNTATTEGALKTIQDIRQWAADFSDERTNKITEGDVVNIRAAIYKIYVVTYLDSNDIAQSADGILIMPDDTSAYYEYTISQDYTPVKDTVRFNGWVPSDATKSHITADTQQTDNLYQKDDVIKITGNVDFKVDQSEGHWIVFHENGKGGTYKAPQFVETGEDTQNPGAMLRKGYTFGGWYTTVTGNPDEHGYTAVDEATEFTFGDDLDDFGEGKLHLYAKWSPVTTAPYTVIMWGQTIGSIGEEDEDKEYEVLGSYVNNNGNVGQNIPYTSVNNGDEDYATGVGDNNGHYTGFNLTEASKNQQVKITPEGDAVLNLYYDRIHYNFKFYLYRNGTQNNRYDYANNSGNGRDLDGLVTWHSNQTQHPSVSGYTLQSESVGGRTYYYFVLPAYYGEDISTSWPTYDKITGANGRNAVSYVMMVGTKLKPNPSSGGDGTVKGLVSVMDENILGATNNSNGNYVVVRFPDSYYNWRYHIWYETIPGEDYSGKNTHTWNGVTYYEDTVLTVRSSNTTVTNQNAPKYQGFDFIDWRGQNWNNRNYWNTTEGNTNLYHINEVYSRQQFKITYFDGNYVDGDGKTIQNRANQKLHESPEIPQGAVIADEYRNYVPTAQEPGYIFEGWYLDEGCTVPYTWGTMPVGPENHGSAIKVYAKWQQIQYRVFLHSGVPQSEEFTWGSDSQAMNFRVPYGGTVSLPTGRDREGWEFLGWYTTPNYVPSSRFTSDYQLTESNVTTNYNKEKDFTDPMNKWGYITGTGANSDVNRPWITKKLDLYAKWHQVLEGADGINVVYDPILAGEGVEPPTGRNAPTDNALYIDTAMATAGAGATADDPDEYQFECWVVQKWNGTAFVDTDVEVYPGDTFEVLKANAKEEDYTDPNNPAITKKYTVKLRAKYKPVEDPTPTHIWWFPNYPGSQTQDNIPVKNNTVITTGDGRVTDRMGINEAVEIKNSTTFTKPGYTFIGWSRQPVSATQSDTNANNAGNVLPLGKNHLYLKWEDGKYWVEKDGAWKQVTAVAADEELPYQDLYAVWVKDYDISVEKVWQNVGNFGDHIPNSVTVELLKNGASFSPAKTLEIVKTDGTWPTVKFEGLPAFDANGNEIHYTVKEQDVTGWKLDGVEYGGGKAYVNQDNYEQPVKVKNSPYYGKITLGKHIAGPTEDYSSVFTNLQFTLKGPKQENNSYKNTYTFTFSEFNNGGTTFSGQYTLEHNDLSFVEPGEYIFYEGNADLLTPWGYSVDTTNPGTTGTTNPVTFTLAEGGDAQPAITNRYTRDTGNLTINKTVTGDHPDGKFPYSVKIKNSEDWWLKQYGTLTSDEEEATVFEIPRTGNTLTGTLTLNNVPTGTYTVVEQGTAAIDSEEDHSAQIPDYTLVVTNSPETVTVEKNKTATAAITNAYTRDTGNLTVTKTVAGDVKTFTKSYSFKLKLNSSESTQWLKEASGTYSLTTNENEAKVWTITAPSSGLSNSIAIEDIPTGSYIVIEQGTEEGGAAQIRNYELEVTYDPEGGAVTVAKGATAEATITNTYTLNAVPVTLKKVVNGNMANVNQEFSFTVKLTKADGTTADEIEGITDNQGYVINPATHNTTFTLKHTDASATTLGEFPIGDKLVITETTGTGAELYKTAYTTTGTAPTFPIETDSKSVTVEVTELEAGKTAIEVICGNYWNIPIETGVTTDSAPYVLAVSAAMMSAAVWMLLRRRAKAAGRED